MRAFVRPSVREPSLRPSEPGGRGALISRLVFRVPSRLAKLTRVTELVNRFEVK